MTNMIGIGPFITIPLLMSALAARRRARLGRRVDHRLVRQHVWSELGAAMPGRAARSAYLRQGYGAEKLGRLMGFLFVWPVRAERSLEIASGTSGSRTIWDTSGKGSLPGQSMLVITIIGLVNLAAALPPHQIDRRNHGRALDRHDRDGHRRDRDRGDALRAKVAFDFPPGAFNFSLGFLSASALPSRVGRLRLPRLLRRLLHRRRSSESGRVIPRSIS